MSSRRDLLLKLISSQKESIWLDSAKTIARCEYIESSGTQWIDTGLQLNGLTSSVKLKISNLNYSLNGYLYQASLSGKNFGLYIYSNGTYILNDYASQGIGVANSILQNYNEHIIEQTNILKIDNETIQSVSQQDFTTTLSLKLFRRAESASLFSSYRLHYFEVYSSDTKVANFIPAFNTTTQKYGLWDTVSQTFFGNQGTGDFTGAFSFELGELDCVELGYMDSESFRSTIANPLFKVKGSPDGDFIVKKSDIKRVTSTQGQVFYVLCDGEEGRKAVINQVYGYGWDVSDDGTTAYFNPIA